MPFLSNQRRGQLLSSSRQPCPAADDDSAGVTGLAEAADSAVADPTEDDDLAGVADQAEDEDSAGDSNPAEEDDSAAADSAGVPTQ